MYVLVSHYVNLHFITDQFRFLVSLNCNTAEAFPVTCDLSKQAPRAFKNRR